MDKVFVRVWLLDLLAGWSTTSYEGLRSVLKREEELGIKMSVLGSTSSY